MKFIFLFLILFFISSNTFAEINSLPFIVQGEMITGIYSERSEIGDRIEVSIKEAVNLRDYRIFIPVDSVFSGEVSEVQEAGRALKKGKVSVKFNAVHYPNGYILYLNAQLVDNEEDFWKQEKENQEVKGRKSFSEKFLSLGKVGAGAAMGGPLGAALATTSLIFDKGGKVRIKPGDPIKIGVSSIDYNNRNFKPQINNINPYISPDLSPENQDSNYNIGEYTSKSSY